MVSQQAYLCNQLLTLPAKAIIVPLMRQDSFMRALFFIIFSCIGIMAVSLSMLSPEWLDLYMIKSKLYQVEQTNLKIEALNRDHQELIDKIHSNPDILKRIDKVVFGIDPNDSNNVAVPTITSQQLQKVKAVLAETAPQKHEIIPPRWLQRCGNDRERLILFIAGAGLIIVSFACFGKIKVNSRRTGDC